MQNIVYERKQNGEDFFSLLSVTTVRFGNRTANVLVTEQPQHSVPFCFFSTWQNAEILLISNDLRFIFTCPLLLAQPITFHCFRHTYASMLYHNGVSMNLIAQNMGRDVANIETYLKEFDVQKIIDANEIIWKLKDPNFPKIDEP